VKNERDIKKNIIPGPFVRPRDRGRRVSHLIKARRKKGELPKPVPLLFAALITATDNRRSKPRRDNDNRGGLAMSREICEN